MHKQCNMLALLPNKDVKTPIVYYNQVSCPDYFMDSIMSIQLLNLPKQPSKKTEAICLILPISMLIL